MKVINSHKTNKHPPRLEKKMNMIHKISTTKKTHKNHFPHFDRDDL